MAPKRVVADGLQADTCEACSVTKASEGSEAAVPCAMATARSSPVRSATHSALVDAILDRVVSQFDLPGLAEKIVNDVAVKLASRITVEALTDAVMHSREEEALTHKLLERTIGGLSQALAAV